MKTLRGRVSTMAGILCLSLLMAAPVAADGGNGQGQNGQGNGGNRGNGGNGNPPLVAATPELDSLALFATGALSMAGYVLLRRRAAKHHDSDPD